MPSGRSILVKCDIKSRAGDIFDMIIAYLNLVEHFYFGLAYSDGNWHLMYFFACNFGSLVLQCFTIFISLQMVNFSLLTTKQKFQKLPRTAGKKCPQPHLHFISESNFLWTMPLFFCKSRYVTQNLSVLTIVQHSLSLCLQQTQADPSPVLSPAKTGPFGGQVDL